MIQVLVWWLILQLLGWLALPTAMRIFRWLPDRGYSFSKPLGLLLVSFILWVGASTRLLSNSLGGILFAILLLAALSTWFYLRSRDGFIPSLGTFLREKWKLVLTVELLFALALLGWAVLRAYAPFKIEPAGGEKFMELAFLNAILRSEYFPPHDPWLSGFGISYYYFGYVMMAVLARLSGALPGVAFDLYDSLLFALTLLGSFGVVYNLVAFSLSARQKPNATAPPVGPPLAAGVLGGVLVTLLGNLEGVLESLHARGVLPDSFWRWLDIPGLAGETVTGSWYPGDIFLWWWRASRILADKDLLGRDLGVQPISEFPFFSFLLGDNHPHVLALPFVLLAIALAFNLLLRQVSHTQVDADLEAGEPSAPWWNPPAFALDNNWLLFFFYALILGSLGFLNTWDLPIYLGVIMLAYAAGSVMAAGRLSYLIVFRSLVLGLGLGILSGLLYLFFYLSFSSQASGILPHVFPPTRLPQYLVMFGTFIFIVLCFLLVYIVRQGSERWSGLKSAFGWWWRILLVCVGLFLLILLLIALVLLILDPSPGSSLAASLAGVLGGMSLREAFTVSLGARLRDPWLLLLLTFLLALVLANVGAVLKRSVSVQDDSSTLSQPAATSSDLFAFVLIFTALALTLVVEFVYLRDAFGVRMNTVFKFYYQAWVMLGIASAYGTWWLVNRLERPASRALFLLGAAIMIGLGLVYPLMAIPTRAGEFKGTPNLDGSSAVARNNPDDWAAIQWLDTYAEQGMPPGSVPVILEAPWSGSYNYNGRISVFTGLPAVLGWSGHEGQWRGNYDEQGKREPDIAAIYTTSDGQVALELLRKWDVSYVILGSPEQSYIQRLCSQPGQSCTTRSALHKFDLFMEPVFMQGNVTIYKVP